MSLLYRRAVNAIPRARNSLGRQISQRNVSSESAKPFQGGLVSHTLAGVLGGSVVIGAGYTWYHFSGLKKVVDAKNRAKVYLQETRQSLSEKHNPSRALVYLRKVAKTYVTPLPGAEVLVDEAFDSVDHIVETHGEEANLILTKAYQEIRDAIRLNGDQRSVTTAIQVMGVLKRRLSELQALGTKVGGDTLGPLWERFPDTQIGLGIGELLNLARSVGADPGGNVNMIDIQDKVKSAISEGRSKAHTFINGKVARLRKNSSDEDKVEESARD